MNKVCAIISGGDFSPLDGIENSDFIIACDKGVEYAMSRGVSPNLILGDFDSFSGRLPDGIPVLSLPVMKDDTDTMAAARHAVNMNRFDELNIYCALGGRLDHLFANIQTGAFAASRGLTVRISDEDTRIIIMPPGEIRLKSDENFSLSVFALSDSCRGLSIRGALYTLEDAEITSAFPIGVSNQWVDDAVISFDEGILMVIMSRMPNS